MRHAQALMVAFLLVIPSIAFAIDFEPFSEPKVTESQWNEYFAQVKASFGASIRELPDEQLVMFHDSATDTYYSFTTTSNPAHPAWIGRRLVQNGDQFSIDQVGYFAGKEEPFAKLYEKFNKKNQEIADDLKKQKEGKH